MDGLATIIVVLLSLIALSGLRLIPPREAAIVECLGKYQGKVLQPGLNYVIPLLERVVYRHTMGEQSLHLPAQQCVTRDNVIVTADAAIYWRIIALEKFYYQTQNLTTTLATVASSQLTGTLSQLQWNEISGTRSEVQRQWRNTLKQAAEPWGISITRVELWEIFPS